jgi:hypothetical protein
VKLGEIAEITTGYQFRGKVSEVSGRNQEIFRLDIKDLNRFGGDTWSHLSATEVTAREPYFLKNFDILFTHKSQPPRAYCIINVPKNTLATNQMLIIRSAMPGITAEFIAWQLNQHPCQQYFSGRMRGDNKKHLSLEALKQTPFLLPDMKLQEQVVKINNGMQMEISTYQKLIANREQYLKGVSRDFFQHVEETIHD